LTGLDRCLVKTAHLLCCTRIASLRRDRQHHPGEAAEPIQVNTSARKKKPPEEHR
jgi:hypothetical protein